MKNLLKATTLIIVMLALPAMAADSGSPMPMNMQHGGTGMDNMQHGNMNMQQGAMQMEGMNMGGNMEPLGDVTVDGVIAQGHVTDVRMEMAKAKQPYTHHLMVMFKDKDGKAMLKGRVAVKVTGPTPRTSAPTWPCPPPVPTPSPWGANSRTARPASSSSNTF